MAGIFHLKYNHPTKLNLTVNFLNCHDVAQAGFNKSGIFYIAAPGNTLTPVWMGFKPVLVRLKSQVYCDLETDGRDWLVSLICALSYCQSKIRIKMKIKA